MSAHRTNRPLRAAAGRFALVESVRYNRYASFNVLAGTAGLIRKAAKGDGRARLDGLNYSDERMLSVLAASIELGGGRHWPDAVDATALTAYALVVLGAPVVGYVLMAIDIRRYLRSLRRALVAVTAVARGSTPHWAVADQPPCLQALELRMPCTEDAVLAAYRRRVKDLHPDRGGDLQQFLRLQKHFEQALHLVRTQAKARASSGG